jgi:hypothetical protein
MLQMLLLQLPPKARRSDPETSHKAAESVSNVTSAQQSILILLANFGALTDEELYSLLIANGVRISQSGARTRRKELVRLNKVKEAGMGRTVSGRASIKWGKA